MKKEILPPIPIAEWMSLATGAVLFGVIEIILLLKGYTDLLLDSIVALVLASALSYSIFGIKDKQERIMSALKSFAIAISLAPSKLIEAMLFTLRLISKLFRALASLIPSLPKYLASAVYLLGILVLNLAMVPVLAVYLTVYGLIFSLSGSTAKIMLRHYDAFGHRMISPLEGYIHPDAIIALITIGIVIAVGAAIINALATASSVAASDAAAAAAGNSLSTMDTFASYVPVFIIALAIAVVLLLWRFFGVGVQAFAMS